MKPVDYSSGDDCDDEISVGCPSPQNQLPVHSSVACSDDDDIQTLVTSPASQLVAVQDNKHSISAAAMTEDSSHHNKSHTSGVRSFSILDILNHRPAVKVTASASAPPEAKIRRMDDGCVVHDGDEEEEEDESKDKIVIRPWDPYHPHLNINPHFSMAAAAAAAAAAAGFLNPVHRYPFAPPSGFGHPPAGNAAAGFHPYHRSSAPFGAGINLNVGLHHHLSPSSSNRASSASPYSGSSVQGDTDMEADDVSTGGSASASPLMANNRQKALLTSGSTSTPLKGHPHRSAQQHPDAGSTPVKGSAGSVQSAAAAGSNASAPNGTPLDALFQMTSKTFEGVNGSADSSGNASGHSQLFSPRQQAKKKRKSRTAFTNHQIFELEKRFLYQKYLSPADRDEIALSLGLTNAQVITWFQNRRAKLKRDMEELKKDVESAKLLGTAAAAAAAAHHHQHPQPPHHHHHHHKGFIGTMAEMSLLQKKADEYHKSISAND